MFICVCCCVNLIEITSALLKMRSLVWRTAYHLEEWYLLSLLPAPQRHQQQPGWSRWPAGTQPRDNSCDPSYFSPEWSGSLRRTHHRTRLRCGLSSGSSSVSSRQHRRGLFVSCCFLSSDTDWDSAGLFLSSFILITTSNNKFIVALQLVCISFTYCDFKQHKMMTFSNRTYRLHSLNVTVQSKLGPYEGGTLVWVHLYKQPEIKSNQTSRRTLELWDSVAIWESDNDVRWW